MRRCLSGRDSDAQRVGTHATSLPRCTGEESADTLTTLNNLGSVLFALGRLAQAEETLRDALRRKQRSLGSSHRSTLTTAMWVATLLLARGELEEAEPLLRSTLATQRQTLGAFVGSYGSSCSAAWRYAGSLHVAL